MKALVKAVNKAVEVLGIASFVVLVILTLLQIVSRYILPVPLSFGDELSRFLFIWTSFLGAAIMMQKNQHIRLDIFQGNISEKTYNKIQLVVFALIAIFSAVFMFAGTQSLEVAAKQTAPVTRLSMGVVYFVLPASGFLMCAYAVSYFFKTLAALKGEGDKK